MAEKSVGTMSVACVVAKSKIAEAVKLLCISDINYKFRNEFRLVPSL